jgi:TonB family protein
MAYSVCFLAQMPTEVAGTPHVKKFVAPSYPSAARKNRMQGTTTTELHIRSDGTVDLVKVVMANAVFHDHVEAALRQWVFEPAKGPSDLKVTVSFKLDCGEVHTERLAETHVQADLPDSVEVRTCPEPVIDTVN